LAPAYQKIGLRRTATGGVADEAVALEAARADTLGRGVGGGEAESSDIDVRPAIDAGDGRRAVRSLSFKDWPRPPAQTRKAARSDFTA